MADLYTLFDYIGALFAAVGLAMIAFGRSELRAAKFLLFLSAGVIVARWTMWSFTTESSWAVRSAAGAVIGAVLLAGFPVIWQWIDNKKEALPSSNKIVDSNQSQSNDSVTGDRVFVKVDGGGTVEGLSIRDATINGFHRFIDVQGTVKDVTVENSSIDANGSGTSVATIEAGYAGPQRHWVIKDKLFVVPFPDTLDTPGVKIGHAAIALRNGFAPNTLGVSLSGDGIISAYLTPHRAGQILQDVKSNEGTVYISIEHPVGTYDVHVRMTNDPASGYEVNFILPQ